jgi:signal peptidase I
VTLIETRPAATENADVDVEVDAQALFEEAHRRRRKIRRSVAAVIILLVLLAGGTAYGVGGGDRGSAAPRASHGTADRSGRGAASGRHPAAARFAIASGAMEPTLHVGQKVDVQRLAPTARVSVGQIVVFTTPPAMNCGGPPGQYMVKRVVGLPGQTISLSGGRLHINGKPLNESWLQSVDLGMTGPGPAGTKFDLVQPYLVPAHDYYVLGDNRADSCDSRYWGPVNRSLIYGVVGGHH